MIAMKQKMLVLPMKKKWFDMILSGVKKQEYREFKPYWNSRVDNWASAYGQEMLFETFFMNPLPIMFVNGYGAEAPRFIGWCNGYSIRSTVRHEEWGEGAYKGIGHYCFHIVRVERG